MRKIRQDAKAARMSQATVEILVKNCLATETLWVAIGKPNEKKGEIQEVPTDTLVSEFLSQYEKQHQILPTQPGKLMVEGKIADPTKTLASLVSDRVSLLNMHYIPFKPAYVPTTCILENGAGRTKSPNRPA